MSVCVRLPKKRQRRKKTSLFSEYLSFSFENIDADHHGRPKEMSIQMK